MKRKYPLAQVYRLLGSGPTVLISSSFKGKPNVMPIAWTTPLDFEPPIVAWMDPGKEKAPTLHHVTGKRFKIGKEM